MARAQNLDKVTFATNWVAQGEHGGFYQALADGTYRRNGLDVTILQGGPNVNHRLLLPVGKIDFYMSANTLQAFDAVAQNIPTVSVAAIFQKDPQVFLAHPNQGINTFLDLKKLTLFVSKEGVATYFQWMKREFGFREEQVKPYTFNRAAVPRRQAQRDAGLRDVRALCGGSQGKIKPKIFLLADQGFASYSTLIETRRELVEKNPTLVQRFVNASIIGWYNYLYRDNQAANALIKRDNPEMTDDLLAYSRAAMIEYFIVDYGVTRDVGIGAITDEHMKSFYDQDGARRRGQGGARLQQGLHDPVREQGRGKRAAAEVTARRARQ